MKQHRQPQTRIVEQGADWYIQINGETRDFDAYVQGEYRGSRKQQTAARMLISDCIIRQARTAAATAR